MNNISASCVSDSLELLAHSHDFADAVVLLPPFYFAPVSSRGLKDFFTAVLTKSRIPSYLYNFPKYTQLKISPGLVRDLAEQIGSLRGVKDSDADINSAISIKENNPHLEVLSGCDESLVEIHSAHLDGVVTGGYNAFSELLGSVRSTAVSGRTEKAFVLQRLFLQWKQHPVHNSLNIIAAIKLSISARIPGYSYRVRPPLLAADQHLETILAQLVKSVVAQHESMTASGSPSLLPSSQNQKTYLQST